MKIVGVIAAKENSNRFKNKNIYNYKGLPLFYHNVKVLTDLAIDTYVATDSEWIKSYCNDKGVKVIWRGVNINQDDQSIFEVLKYVYYRLPDFDIMVNILANVINVQTDDILRLLQCLNDNNLREVRSYNNGVESGCMALRKSVFNNFQISAYCGAIINNSTEIHYEAEITEGY